MDWWNQLVLDSVRQQTFVCLPSAAVPQGSSKKSFDVSTESNISVYKTAISHRGANAHVTGYNYFGRELLLNFC